MSETYASIKTLHSSLPSFQPPISTSLLPSTSLVFLLAFFALTFIFTTLPKSKVPLPEITTALVASALAGGGVVALFCTLGVYV
ncbi:hypothetical protein I302_101228 [Kwoniella bestiolae CBS 10118]|uniref:Dolichyl-diphosphooligosaccharide-protein glycosyltransferase subunit OST5 n=1 Tax=Kwoniella bestiolae CBS 10118 TaxID=1296100 RepID=A0A1B9G7E2_9TREE|nr:hypothetical protein I302_04601 [Kwoniella bestiolae CBS 10118]OCF26910.1 hypothetical protein I302_04601 [Kwoniella bestiolae CBS 10118]